jgi:hypothetical protein
LIVYHQFCEELKRIEILLDEWAGFVMIRLRR